METILEQLRKEDTKHFLVDWSDHEFGDINERKTFEFEIDDFVISVEVSKYYRVNNELEVTRDEPAEIIFLKIVDEDGTDVIDDFLVEDLKEIEKVLITKIEFE